MTPDSPTTGLYEKILSKEGIVGLLLFMTVSFLMFINYQGQKANNEVLIELREYARQSAIKDVEATDILKDIRYALRENGGLTFRNSVR